MSFNRYSSGCGCSAQAKRYASSRGTSCCNKPVAAPPQPCCEATSVEFVPGSCWYPTCNITATTDPFWIAFKNQCGVEAPIALGTVFFFSQSAGFLNVHNFNGNSYQVSLTDVTKVGQVISEDSCVLLAAIPPSDSVAGGSRCLSGQFVAPALDASATIFILNGSSIPIGATITFTAEGETGSYLVTAYISGSNGIYAYTVQNTGSGLTPNTIVDAGAASTCAYPIEVITDVDFCNLSESETADSLTACLNGSPRAFVPVGEDYVPRGTAEGIWDQAKLLGFDCCLIADGCIKFSGLACTEAVDTILVRATGVECFSEIYNNAIAHNEVVTALIGSLPVIIESWNEDARVLVLKPAVDDYLPPGESLLEYPAGTQICVGECCRQCTNGDQTTNIFIDYAGEGDTTFVVGPVTLAYDDASPTEYLIGFDTTGALDTLVINTSFPTDGELPTGRPLVSDPLVIRQKICNTHPNGCSQDAELEFNFEIRAAGMLIPEELVGYYEIGSFVSGAETLADGVTPNTIYDPYLLTSSQAAVAGTLVGISTTRGNLDETVVGYGGPADGKTFPYEAGFFKDHAQLPHCACALNIVWCYILLVPQKTIVPGAVTITLAVRRHINKKAINQITLPDNDPESQGFNS